MENNRLELYHLDMKYVRDLAKKDDRVYSVSPQTQKEKRPFVGIIIVCSEKKYCIPLSSPKPKHKSMKNDKDFTKIIVDDKLIGVLNFSAMVPVDDSVIRKVDLKINKNDDSKEVHYKKMCSKQLRWCQKNVDAITKKANDLYAMVTVTPEKSINLTRRCCDFLKLESILKKYIGSTNES